MPSDILPAQYFLQAGAADIRCIYLRHSAQETIFTESRDKEPRFVRRTAIINYPADVTLSVSSIRRNDNIRVVQPPRAPWREKFTKLRELRKNKRHACSRVRAGRVPTQRFTFKTANFNYLEYQNWIIGADL